MTNLEYIRSMTDAELAAFLCDLTACESCDECMAYNHCSAEHNGMDEWLNAKYKEGSF